MSTTQTSTLPIGRVAHVPASGLTGTTVRVCVPWAAVSGWVLHGNDGQGRPVRQSASTSSGRPIATDPGTSRSIAVPLPEGFVGTVDLHGAGRAMLGRIRLDASQRLHEGHTPLPRPGAPLGKLGAATGAVGANAVRADSNDLEVRWIGSDELLVDRRSRETQCYVQLPASLRATRIVLQPEGGGATDVPLNPHGASFSLSSGFKGSMQMIDSTGLKLAEIRIRYLYPTAGGVEVKVAPDRHKVTIGRPGGVLQVQVLPTGFRAGIC